MSAPNPERPEPDTIASNMDAKQLREAFAKHGIRRVKVGGYDVDGILRGKYVALEKFWGALEDSHRLLRRHLRLGRGRRALRQLPR